MYDFISFFSVAYVISVFFFITTTPPPHASPILSIMTSHGDGVNPLRPYYIRPSIGERIEPAAPGPKAFSSASARSATTSTAVVAAPSRYASKARDMFGDLDYKGYMDDEAPSMARSVKELLDDLIWKYTSVLMAQPFEVAKTILQARNQDENALLAASVETDVFARSFSSQGLGIYDVCNDVMLCHSWRSFLRQCRC